MINTIRENSQRSVPSNKARIPICPTCNKGTPREKTRYSTVDFEKGVTNTQWKCLQCNNTWIVTE